MNVSKPRYVYVYRIIEQDFRIIKNKLPYFTKNVINVEKYELREMTLIQREGNDKYYSRE